MPYLESALRHGSPFEAFHLYSTLHASTARRPVDQGGKPGFCGAAVAWFKLVAERGSWNDNYLLEAEKAWARGQEESAMVGWIVAAEMGSEAAQNTLGKVTKMVRWRTRPG
jgi:SEL1 protein